MPFCLVFDSSMFPRLYNSFNNGLKFPIVGAWLKSTELNVNPIGATISLELQNPSSYVAILEVLLKILDVIDVDPDEVLPKIPDSIVIDLDEITELLNSQSNPQVGPPRKKQKLNVDGVGKKHHKKSYDSSRKFQAKWATKLLWVEGLMVAGGII